MASRLFNSVDLFSGCGGLSLGLKEAGFRVRAFSEISDSAAETFALNFKNKPTRLSSVPADQLAQIRRLKNEWAANGIEIDLICGGPPCQGFSGIGHRRTYAVAKEDIPSNFLYGEMIESIKLLKPKLFLFENVGGLLTGSWKPKGQRGEIWERIRNDFKDIGDYEIGWKLLYAKHYGVPQNRPRVFLVGLKKSIAVKLKIPDSVWADVKDNSRGLLPEKTRSGPNIEDVLSDLVDPEYPKNSVNDFYLNSAMSEFQKNIRRLPNGRMLKKRAPLTEQVYTRHSERITKKFQHMLRTGEISSSMKTKKFAQRVLPEKWEKEPTITITSLPDDFVHYSQPRILTVREWARLQTFPDWFQFRGPRTTGGLRRAGQPTEGIWDREVPKYTQIGNAVPVALARAIGEHLVGLLTKNVQKS